MPTDEPCGIIGGEISEIEISSCGVVVVVVVEDVVVDCVFCDVVVDEKYEGGIVTKKLVAVHPYLHFGIRYCRQHLNTQ